MTHKTSKDLLKNKLIISNKRDCDSLRKKQPADWQGVIDFIKDERPLIEICSDSKELYQLKISRKLKNVFDTLVDIELIHIFIEESPRKEKYQEQKITRMQYLQYHLENYYFRLSGAYDRLLLLINEVYALGLAPDSCTHCKICNHMNIKFQPVHRSLKRLQKFLSESNTERILITHRNKFNEHPLILIGLTDWLASFDKRGIGFQAAADSRYESYKQKRVKNMKLFHNEFIEHMYSVFSDLENKYTAMSCS